MSLVHGLPDLNMLNFICVNANEGQIFYLFTYSCRETLLKLCVWYELYLF